MKASWTATYLGNNYQRDFFPYVVLSLQINSIQFTDLNISDSSRNIFLLNGGTFKFMCNMYLAMFSFTVNWTPFQLLYLWYTSCWKSVREKLWRSTVLVWPCRPTRIREVSWQSGIRGHRPALLKALFWLVNANGFTHNLCVRICFVAFWKTYQGSCSCNKHWASTRKNHSKKSLDLRILWVISLFWENILTSVSKTGLSLVTVVESGLYAALADESAELLTKFQLHHAFFFCL